MESIPLEKRSWESTPKACPTSEDNFVANTVGNTFSCLGRFKQKDKTMLATLFCENFLRCGSGLTNPWSRKPLFNRLNYICFVLFLMIRTFIHKLILSISKYSSNDPLTKPIIVET